MPKWVRSGVLEAAPELVAELGGSYVHLAAKTALPADPLTMPDLPVPAEAVVSLLDLAAAELNEECFGLRLGIRQSLALFGPMAPLLASAESIGVLLTDLAAYFPLHTQGTIVGLERDGTDRLLTYELSADTGQYQRQVIELGFGVVLRELERHAPGWRPSAVFVRHSPPIDRTWHRRLLGDHVMYNSDRNAILCDSELLARSTRGGDRLQHEPLARHFGTETRKTHGLEVVRTEALVRAMLPFASIDLDRTAELLGCSRRTLQRRLAAKGTSFAEIFDRARASLAHSYLRESDLKVSEIAEILQFSETSALSRFVRRSFQKSPRELREPSGSL